MKCRFKYLTAMFLTAAVIMSSSCQSGSVVEKTNNETSTITGSEEVTTIPNNTDSVPELDFKGYVLNIGTPDNTHYNGDLCVKEQNGEIYNDALYKRENSIEERFNISIEEQVYGNGQANVLRDLIIKETAAGDNTYDFVMMTDRYALQLALQGTSYDINDIPHIDINKDYWTRQINESMAVGGKLYFLFGDISTTALDFTHLLAFNTRLVNEYSLQSPYELVRSGEWTFDKFTSMAKTVANDVNSDGVQDANGYVRLGIGSKADITLLLDLRRCRIN